MKWKVYLSGDDYDLSELSRGLKTCELCIDRDENGFFLSSPELNSLDSYEEVNKNTNESLQLMFGVIKLLLHARRPIEIDHLMRINEDGSPTRISLAVGDVSMHFRASARWELHPVNGSVTTGATSDAAADWVTLAQTEENVANVFRLVAVDAESWSGLYKIVEAIKEDAGDIIKEGWVSRKALRRFKHTADSPSAVGLDARHARKDNQPPPEPMSLPEARVFVQGIVHNWMSKKLQQRHARKE